MEKSMEFGFHLVSMYSNRCKPLCHEYNMPQTALDILMFLANHPMYKTAGDIVKMRRIKANLVSVNVDKLVNDGYLVRDVVKGDRRKTKLILTKKADRIIQKGMEIQKDFKKDLFKGINPQEMEIFLKTIRQLENNMEHMKEGKE
ncbi:MAG: MarR family winged helix-turn-helix transcriptional regulator [Floccifex sp.]